MHFINRVRAKEGTHLPLVMSMDEVKELLSVFFGRHKVMARLLYGSGMRHKETRTLGHKDVKTTMISAHVMNRPGLGRAAGCEIPDVVWDHCPERVNGRDNGPILR